jgi:hypothetical protein
MTGERVQLTDYQLGIPMSQQATKASLAGEQEESLVERVTFHCPFGPQTTANHYKILTYKENSDNQNR